MIRGNYKLSQIDNKIRTRQMVWRGGGLVPASRWGKSDQPPADSFWRDALAALAMVAGWAAWGAVLLVIAGCGSDRITRDAVTLTLLGDTTIRCEGGVTITMGFVNASHQCHAKNGTVWLEVDSGFVKAITHGD